MKWTNLMVKRSIVKHIADFANRTQESLLSTRRQQVPTTVMNGRAAGDQLRMNATI